MSTFQASKTASHAMTLMRMTIRSGARATRRAMTFVELLIALVVVVMLLGGMVQVADGLIADSAEKQTVETLEQLDKALRRYFGSAKPPAWPSASEPSHISTPMARCLFALRGKPETHRLVENLPGITQMPDGWETVYDGFGQPMLYIDPNDPLSTTFDWVRPNDRGGTRLPVPNPPRPFIVSAGPDGMFGDLTSPDPAAGHAVMDNLYSF